MCGVWRGYDIAGIGGGEFALRLVLRQRVALLYWRSDTHTHTRSAASNKSSSLSSSAASAVGVVPPAIPRSIEGTVGAAAFLQVRATQAAAIANAAANDAAAVSSAHGIILDKHCTMFFQRALGINPDGTAVDQAVLPNCLKKYKSIKTVNQ